MKTSLGEQTEQQAEETKSSTAVAAAPQADAGIVPDNFFSNSEMEGDFERSDFKIPRLNLVQGVGPLSEHHQPGIFVYNKEHELGSSLELTLLRLRKYFIEDLPYGSDTMPNILNTIEEVHKAGAYLTKEKRTYGEDQTYYKPALDATVLIKGAPDNETFPFEYSGTPYALALWTLQSVAYGRTGTTLITAAQLGLRNGLATGYWSVSAKREKVGQNFIWLPVARQAGKNSPEFVEWTRELFANGNNS